MGGEKGERERGMKCIGTNREGEDMTRMCDTRCGGVKRIHEIMTVSKYYKVESLRSEKKFGDDIYVCYPW